MEKLKKYVCCLGCLTNVSEITLQSYIVQNENIKSIFQADSIYLCYLCKRIAQKAEMFIQNVQSNQILLENFQNIMDSTFQLVRMQIQPLVNLNESAPIRITLSPQTTEQSGDKTEDVIEKFTIVENCIEQEVKIKLEIKEEEGYLHDHLEGEFVDDDEFQESCDVKEENEFSLRALVKEEVKIEYNLKTNQCRKSVEKNSKKDESQEKLNKEPRARTVYITKEECLREKEEMMQDEKYINSTYKCEDCVKGFTFKASYEKHMERHSKENGDYVCDICKQRWHSEDKLHSHRRSHLVRYKCAVCSLTRVSRLTIQDHYTAFHCFGFYQYNCPQCPKVFKRKVSLRKHVHYSHTHAQRVECAHCHKSYANKEVLKSHMIMRHPKYVGAVAESKRFVCQECGMAFKAPSHLKKHSIKHSHKREYYCVECDKSFKSDSVLKQHLKTASPHVNYLELPLPCLECDKRFAIRRDLERHVNRVHLNVRPYQCDRCDKAYVNNWSLNEHRRIVHEGYKRPLRYSCTFCSKVFDRNQILKGHLRTHTGERPYQCSKCPAKFSQSSVLGTHVKLIHLKLTRDGKPKAINLK